MLFHRPQGHELSLEAKSRILSEMIAVGSLAYVQDILTRMHDEMLKTLDDVEAELGSNKKLRILVISLRL
jgi:geranylgeranyl diphosphate synthase type 3